MNRSIIATALLAFSSVAMADIGGIYLCSNKQIDSSQKPELVGDAGDGYYSISANGATAILAPLAIGYVPQPQPWSYLLLAASGTSGAYTGLSATLGRVSGNLASDGVLSVNIYEISMPDLRYQLVCKKVW